MFSISKICHHNTVAFFTIILNPSDEFIRSKNLYFRKFQKNDTINHFFGVKWLVVVGSPPMVSSSGDTMVTPIFFYYHKPILQNSVISHHGNRFAILP